MGVSVERSSLGQGIDTFFVKADKFKTVRASLCFVMPVDQAGASAAALLMRVLTHSCAKYPDYISLSKQLNRLYGASLSGDCIRIGDAQLLRLSVSVISGRYALDGEDMLALAGDLLCECTFNPKVTDSAFDAEDFEIERRQLIEQIESRINEKRRYAILRTLEQMCAGEPFGIPDGGSVETVKSLTPQSLYSYWQNMLENAPVIISSVGAEPPQALFSSIALRLSNNQRDINRVKPVFAPVVPEKVRFFDESLSIAQAKLVMGFRTGISSLACDNTALRMAVDIFGGAPYSRLFTVVREKLSLCYYCAARLYGAKGILCVDSGIETENFEKSKNGILEQLDIMKSGSFDDDVISASRMGLADSARSATDSAAALEAWYLARAFDACALSPEQFIERVGKVTKDDIVKAANEIKLDTVYLLKGTEDAANG